MAQARVSRQHGQLAGSALSPDRTVHLVGQDGLATSHVHRFGRRLAEDGPEAHVRHDVGDLVVVRQAGVGEGRRLDPEDVVHLLTVQRDLFLELGLVGVGEEGRVRVVIGLFEELDLTSVAAELEKPLEFVEDVRLVEFRLFDERAGETQTDLEVVVRVNQVREQLERGDIAAFRSLCEDLPILLIPKERGPLRAQPKRLVKLKTQRQQRHCDDSQAAFPRSRPERPTPRDRCSCRLHIAIQHPFSTYNFRI